MKKSQILSALEKLSQKLAKAGIKGEIGIVGGAAMVLAFNARSATKDVDAIFFPASKIRDLAKEISGELHLPTDWLNDAVKGFLPGKPKRQNPVFESDYLKVWVPEPEYPLAMKALAARFDTADAADLKLLIEHLKLSSPEKVFKVIESYYPKKAIPVKTQFFVEELFE